MKIPTAREEQFYDQVANELKDNSLIPGLWTKAYAETDGDKAKAQALYIKYRVAQLMTTANQELIIRQAQAFNEKKQQAMVRFRRFVLTIIGVSLIMIAFMCFIIGSSLVYIHYNPSTPADKDIGIVDGGIIILLAAIVIAIAGIKSLTRR